MTEPVSPCRLYVYLAREAPLGVVVRRGPSPWVRLSLWHTDTDELEHGQWFRGRVYERRSDVSADGSLFLYFARKSTAPYPRETWVAISRPPFFTALALWFVGGTYCTGGFFPSPTSVWLGFGVPQPDIGALPPRLTPSTEPPPYVDGTNEWTDRTVFVNRLLRDGWQPSAMKDVWEKPGRDNRLSLVMTQRVGGFNQYGGYYSLDFSVRDVGGGEERPIGRATWADWDHRGRLMVAQNGRLLHWDPSAGFTQIEDFNPQRPEPMDSPDWAREWPSPRG